MWCHFRSPPDRGHLGLSQIGIRNQENWQPCASTELHQFSTVAPEPESFRFAQGSPLRCFALL